MESSSGFCGQVVRQGSVGCLDAASNVSWDHVCGYVHLGAWSSTGAKMSKVATHPLGTLSTWPFILQESGWGRGS